MQYNALSKSWGLYPSPVKIGEAGAPSPHLLSPMSMLKNFPCTKCNLHTAGADPGSGVGGWLARLNQWQIVVAKRSVVIE